MFGMLLHDCLKPMVCASAVLSLFVEQAGIVVQVPAADCGGHHEQQRNLWG